MTRVLETLATKYLEGCAAEDFKFLNGFPTLSDAASAKVNPKKTKLSPMPKPKQLKQPKKSISDEKRNIWKTKILALVNGELTEESLEEIKKNKLDKVQKITDEVFGHQKRSDDLNTCPLCLIKLTANRYTKRHMLSMSCKWRNINKPEEDEKDDDVADNNVEDNEETPTPALDSLTRTVLTNFKETCGFHYGQLPANNLNDIEEPCQLTPFDGLLKTDKFEKLQMWKAVNDVIIFNDIAPARTEEEKKLSRETLMKATRNYKQKKLDETEDQHMYKHLAPEDRKVLNDFLKFEIDN